MFPLLIALPICCLFSERVCPSRDLFGRGTGATELLITLERPVESFYKLRRPEQYRNGGQSYFNSAWRHYDRIGSWSWIVPVYVSWYYGSEWRHCKPYLETNCHCFDITEQLLDGEGKFFKAILSDLLKKFCTIRKFFPIFIKSLILTYHERAQFFRFLLLI